MTQAAEFPATREEALRQGFEQMPEAANGDGLHPFGKGVGASTPESHICQTSPAGTRCYQYVYPNGDRVVGFCNGNGHCILYVQRGDESPDQ